MSAISTPAARFGTDSRGARRPIQQMRWADYQLRGLSIARVHCHRLAPQSVQGLHEHDFAELFWCFHGSCQHLLNGKLTRFAVGDLVLLRPGDTHEIRTGPDEECFYYLVCFPLTVFARLAESAPAEVREFWGTTSGTRVRRLSARGIGHFEHEFLELQRDPHSPLLLHRFLLNLLHDLRSAPQDPLRECPDWLRQAFREFSADPDLLARGGSALIALTGRGREHIARTLQRTAGLTTSAAINRARVGWASARLVLSEDPISSIALECGYESLSHFYAAFRRFTGMAPRAYRLHHRTTIDSR